MDGLRELPQRVARLIHEGDVPPGMTTPCWIWSGRLNRNGYGRVTIWKNEDGYIKKHEPVVHRYVYEKIVGPIPAKHVLDHKCRVRRCCNPCHMEPVTYKENTLRGNAVLYQKAAEYVEVVCVGGDGGSGEEPTRHKFAELRESMSPESQERAAAKSEEISDALTKLYTSPYIPYIILATLAVVVLWLAVL